VTIRGNAAEQAESKHAAADVDADADAANQPCTPGDNLRTQHNPIKNKRKRTYVVEDDEDEDNEGISSQSISPAIALRTGPAKAGGNQLLFAPKNGGRSFISANGGLAKRKSQAKIGVAFKMQPGSTGTKDIWSAFKGQSTGSRTGGNTTPNIKKFFRGK
jgi:hypothetical protein